MTKPTPFSPPFPVGAQGYGCYVDVDGTPHLATWTGDWAVNDFGDTSGLCDFHLSSLELDPEVIKLWNSSQLLGFGADACARLASTGLHPVMKIAHPSDTCRLRIEREFRIMRSLSSTGTVAQVSDEPLMDGDGIFGFWLEKLDAVTHEELKIRHEEVEHLLKTLHAAGYCHGDPSFSNIMQNKEGKLVFIDLAFAGPLGDPVHDDIPVFMFPKRLYTVETDWRAVDFWIKLGG